MLVQLDIEGMTCASCAARVEKKLNKVDGVEASVNYATERATVEAPGGMTVDELIAVVEKSGYGARLPQPNEPDHDEAAKLRPRMILAFLLGLPVILVSMVPALQFPTWQWWALVLSLIVVFWCGRSFHQATWTNLKHGATTMDTLVSLGTITAMAWSIYAMFFGHAGEIGMTHEFEFNLSKQDALGFVYFEAAVAIIAFLLLGRYIEAKAKRESGKAMRELLEVGAKRARRLNADGSEQEIDVRLLRVGDKFVVRPGEKIAADGTIVEGRSEIDQSIITGESLPVPVEPSASVVGGAVNTTGRLVVEATAVGEDSQLAQIGKLVEEAQTGKADVQRLADKVTTVFVPAVIVIALIALVVWLLVGAGLTFSLSAAIAVLIIACPCALGLATPSALMVGTGRGAQLGIIIRGPQVLEQARKVSTIVFDKTGTITEGSMSIASVEPVDGVSDEELLHAAATVESASEHPIARALTRDVETGALTEFENLPGRGVCGLVDGVEVHAGSPALLEELGLEVPARASETLGSEVWVAADGRVLGRIVVADTLKENAAEVIKELHHLGLKTVMLSGDNEPTARAVAQQVGIDEVRAGVSPQGKVDAIKEYQAGGVQVAMVGDGVNDAAALAQADLGIAMGSGTDAAIAAGDITLMRHDLMAAVDAVRLSRATLGKIKSNLVWAFAYNTAAIPLAAFGLLTPMIAGAAMAFSSVFVVLNSLLLKGFRPIAATRR